MGLAIRFPNRRPDSHGHPRQPVFPSHHSLPQQPPAILYPKNIAAKPHFREELGRSRVDSALYAAGGDDGLTHGADVEKSIEQRELRGVHPAPDGLQAGKPYSRILMRTAGGLTPISSTTRRVRRYCTGLVRSLSSRTALISIRSLSC
jgi:hypothetical protein